VPTLKTSQLSGATIDKLEVDEGTLVILFKCRGGKFKVQAKDSAQGGIFQMEPEFSGNVELTHTLGPTVFYFVNEVTKKINFGDGIVSLITCNALNPKLKPYIGCRFAFPKRKWLP
jgi:hypothetical protein